MLLTIAIVSFLSHSRAQLKNLGNVAGHIEQ